MNVILLGLFWASEDSREETSIETRWYVVMTTLPRTEFVCSFIKMNKCFIGSKKDLPRKNIY